MQTGHSDAFGFKLIDPSGKCAAAFSIPSSELIELLSPFLAIHCHLTLDGDLSSQLELMDQVPKPNKVSALRQLVNAVLAPASLQDEPDVGARLSNLREIFAQSLNLIDGAIAENPTGAS